MVLGSLSYLDDGFWKDMPLIRVNIEGTQHDLIIFFNITQIYFNSTEKSVNTEYIIPNQNEFFLYDTKISIGEKTFQLLINQIQSEEEINYKGKFKDNEVIIKRNLPQRLSKFRIGHIPKKTDLKKKESNFKNHYIDIPEIDQILEKESDLFEEMDKEGAFSELDNILNDDEDDLFKELILLDQESVRNN